MAWHDSVKTRISAPVVGGAVALFLGFGGFGTWAAVAPLEGAVIASGQVVASGRNKVVQHLEGGIVKKILVEEGDRVAAGEAVLTLDLTAAESVRDSLVVQFLTLTALEARFLAERDGAEVISFPKSLQAERDISEVDEVIEDQRAEFRARIDRYKAELEILTKKISARDEEIVGLKAQRQASEEQLELIVEEKDDSASLLTKGLITKTRVLELRRMEAELKGRIGQLSANIAQAKHAIAEAEQEVQRAKATRMEEAIARLGEVRLQQSDIAQQLRSAQDAWDRVVVRAPASGKVMSLTKYNPGAVIAPGETILEIVPDEADLIVEAHVLPQDIDQVHVGQEARLNFAALDQREVPPIPGEVLHVSADRLTNERTGEAYYLARVKISSEPIAGFQMSQVGPGQPVEVFISTGDRTLLAYLAEPITKTLRRAMRES